MPSRAFQKLSAVNSPTPPFPLTAMAEFDQPLSMEPLEQEANIEVLRVYAQMATREVERLSKELASAKKQTENRNTSVNNSAEVHRTMELHFLSKQVYLAFILNRKLVSISFFSDSLKLLC